jgi:hypothetical protein
MDSQDGGFSGGCACGVLRYACSVGPQAAFHCQCRQCQRATGGGHASLLVVPAGAVSIEGDAAYYDQSADDGATVSRGFCPACGSPVLGRTTGHPEALLIHAASLDDPALFRPQRVVFHDAAQPWDFIDPALPAG